MTELKVALLLLTGFIFLLVQYEPQLKSKIDPLVIVHGGAYPVKGKSIQLKLEGVREAAKIGFQTLKRTGNVLDVVQAAIYYMESNGEFNCGYGSALNTDGKIEMDAGIQNGADLQSGSVSLVRDILSPISLARLVMEKSPHAHIGAEGAMKFARLNNVTILPEGALVTQKAKDKLESYINGAFRHKIGTVGCVVIDEFGNIAAGTSTGGYTGKLPGRIGDSVSIGAGTMADNRYVGISASGRGENFIRYNVAGKILALIQYKGLSAQEATEKILAELEIQFKSKKAGVVSIDAKGNVGVYSTAEQFSWAYLRGKELHSGILQGDHFVQQID